ncbi:dephospho-CoA kinase [Neobacillus sp. D3-1R]|uniref:dephospho-CoA kinase n=1 Tax=Neobacillus sp. D3-1R TaxID=3445778 RepID=UPI003FA06E84
MALIIGLTGGIASGKSTVSQMLRDMDIPIVDADIAARKVVEKGETAYQKIIEAFGADILTEDGDINRVKLGSIVFHDEEKRLQLNAIVHPAVRENMNQEKDNYIAAGHTVIVLDIPLLFESKLTHMVDRTLLVYVDEATQLQRLMSRNPLSEQEALARIHSQMPLKNKVNLADEVINNNGTLEVTKEQLLHVLRKWQVI